MNDSTSSKAPGFAKKPDYPITVEPAGATVSVSFAGETIAESRGAVVLKESAYPSVYYFPREDVRMDLLSRTDQSTYCPFKGHASYWSIGAAKEVENGVWSYETPYDEMEEIRGRLAFWFGKDDRLILKTDG